MVRRKVTMVIDPTMCDGHGVCAELFPERVRMDPWGYPIIDGGDIPLQLLDHAQRAVESCPRLALHLVERRQSSGRVDRKERHLSS
jgi:ferredoxin